MKKYSFSVTIEFEIPDSVEMCPGECQGECGGECDDYCFGVLHKWTGKVTEVSEDQREIINNVDYITCLIEEIDND